MDKMSYKFANKKETIHNILDGYISQEFYKNYYLVDLNKGMVKVITEVPLGEVIACMNRTGSLILHISQ